MSLDFSSLELSNDRLVAAALTHATFYVQASNATTYDAARATVDAAYKSWLDQVRQDRGVKMPQTP